MSEHISVAGRARGIREAANILEEAAGRVDKIKVLHASGTAMQEAAKAALLHEMAKLLREYATALEKQEAPAPAATA